MIFWGEENIDRSNKDGEKEDITCENVNGGS